MNKFVLNNIRPKDYDPDSILIELKIDNKYSPSLLFNNNIYYNQKKKLKKLYNK